MCYCVLREGTKIGQIAVNVQNESENVEIGKKKLSDSARIGVLHFRFFFRRLDYDSTAKTATGLYGSNGFLPTHKARYCNQKSVNS